MLSPLAELAGSGNGGVSIIAATDAVASGPADTRSALD